MLSNVCSNCALQIKIIEKKNRIKETGGPWNGLSYELNCLYLINNTGNKVKSAYESSGSSGCSLSRFL